MKIIPVILNAIVATLSVGFFLYTFVAVGHLEGLARDFVTEKTLAYSRPVIVTVEKSLESPLVRKLLSENQEKSIRGEIESYKENPQSFIRELTGAARTKERPGGFLSAGSKISSFKDKVRAYYDDTLTALIRDFRIFSGSNAVAGIIALVLALRRPRGIRKYALWFSFLLFAAVLFSSYLYIDGMSFFRILFRSHMGWWYPVSLLIMTSRLFVDSGHIPAEFEAPPEKRKE